MKPEIYEQEARNSGPEGEEGESVGKLLKGRLSRLISKEQMKNERGRPV